MTAALQQFNVGTIRQEIQCHGSWFGMISGLDAEKLLEERPQYSYLLRAGEFDDEIDSDYYVSFVLPDHSIKHVPFVITITYEGWYYENNAVGGPYTDACIDDVIHLIMHCEKDEPLNIRTPIILFN